jgi:hypothetical protein
MTTQQINAVRAEAADEVRVMSQTRTQTLRKRRALLSNYVQIRVKLAIAENILSNPTTMGRNMAEAYKEAVGEVEETCAQNR